MPESQSRSCDSLGPGGASGSSGGAVAGNPNEVDAVSISRGRDLLGHFSPSDSKTPPECHLVDLGPVPMTLFWLGSIPTGVPFGASREDTQFWKSETEVLAAPLIVLVVLLTSERP
jgi:hypothetical protein